MNQNAYLFAWNPNNWPSSELYKDIEKLKETGKVELEWNCTNNYNKIKRGDRAFLIRIGVNPKGIIGSGTVTSDPFLSKHWSDPEKKVHTVKIEFDVLIDADKDPILLQEDLEKTLPSQLRSPRSSVTTIGEEIIPEIEKEWFEFLATTKLSFNPFEENSDNLSFLEGAALQVTQTRYERNSHARNECLKYHGYSCSVCEFNFEKKYGALGDKFIHVHHLTEISKIKKEYIVNPIEDLRPVCPNCHAMLHKRNPSLTIEELKQIIKN